MTFVEEIKRRRTFAIISHPDAGKTTLTEKLLLFGGAIHTAGAVKSNKIKKTATSDFMEIEKQRGISVATSVMGFEYSYKGNNLKINILDTPGHQDFAEDTYRTLTAVDSVIVVIDGAKGVEAQTRKLMDVCRMRKTPVMVFINKFDRPCRDPFDLLDEVEKELKIRVTPLFWPNGSGDIFKGIIGINETTDDGNINDELELARQGYGAFDRNEYLSGDVAPVVFGSALNNTGVEELLHTFCEIAPSPMGVQTENRIVAPEEEKFSGFVFKIHANIDPNHRSRIAFVKVCSGRFERNKSYHHVQLNKELKFTSPTAFMADKKSIIDEAYPGDIIGIPDTGNFKISDSLSEGEKLVFKGIPSFSPELFRYIENDDPMKAKQLAKGIDQLMDEGVAQLFVNQFNNRKIIGCVGALQFEVIQYRLLHEYGASCRYEGIDLYKACWFARATEQDETQEDVEKGEAEIADFKRRKAQYLARDKDGRDVFLAESKYVLDMAQQDFKHIRFYFTSER